MVKKNRNLVFVKTHFPRFSGAGSMNLRWASLEIGGRARLVGSKNIEDGFSEEDIARDNSMRKTGVGASFPQSTERMQVCAGNNDHQ